MSTTSQKYNLNAGLVLIKTDVSHSVQKLILLNCAKLIKYPIELLVHLKNAKRVTDTHNDNIKPLSPVLHKRITFPHTIRVLESKHCAVPTLIDKVPLSRTSNL